MKVKSIPSDFRVSENVSLHIVQKGTFYAFALEKEGLTTSEALDVLSRKTGIRRTAWRHAGLKDKHAHTRQFVTIPAGEWRGQAPRRGAAVTTRKARLELIGRCSEAIRRGHITSNKFRVTIRNLTRARIALMTDEWELLAASGMPNYFDTQRFGACRHGGGLVLAELLCGNGEKAARVLLTAISRKDHRVVKEKRKTAERLWGRWEDMARALPDSPERAAAKHLSGNEKDFEGALAAYENSSGVPYNVLAFQSMLYNLMVSHAVQESAVPFFRVKIGERELAYATRKPDILSEEDPLSLFYPGNKFIPPWDKALSAACAELGVAPESVDSSDLPRKMWDRSARRTWTSIRQTAKPRVIKDDIYPDRRALILSFELPPASYATLAIKRLQHAK